MTIRHLGLSLACIAAAAAPLGAQEIADRLAGRVPPEVAAIVQQLSAAAAARGLPVDPLIQKAIEGSAKGVTADRVTAAVRAVADQLDTAAVALRGAGLTGSDTVAIAAGGFAINAGLNGRQVAALARAGAPRSVAVALRVAGTLTALGVPPAESVELVSASLGAGQEPADLLALPGQVQAEMARGVRPSQAAAGLARAAAAQARGGPPSGRGRPAQPPAHPKP